MNERCQECGTETFGTPFCTACGTRLSAPAEPAAPVEYASFWARLTAFALDAMVIGFTALLLTLAASAAYRAGAGRLPDGWWGEGFFVLGFFLSVLLGVAYHATFTATTGTATTGTATTGTATTGQTPGKAALGIMVQDVGQRRLGYGRAILRALAYELSWAPCQLGFLWALWDKKHQAWHDKIAGTVVVRKD